MDLKDRQIEFFCVSIGADGTQIVSEVCDMIVRAYIVRNME